MHRSIAVVAAISLTIATMCAQSSGTVRVSPQKVLRTFDPSRALGAAIDGHDQGELDRRLTPANVSQMLEAGLGPITYRLRTELGGETWHWNALGAWSDAAGQQGYWTSSTDSPTGGISLSYGYSLPRRGNTVDQANNDGYSRIDDGDEATFWKSNPYLDRTFTQESNSLHPQWVVIDLEKVVSVNAIRIAWGEQFATRFQVEYSTERLTADFGLRPVGGWRPFAHGSISQRRAESRTRILSKRPVLARYVRLLLTRAEHDGPPSIDIRDNVGFSIREIYVGTGNRNGSLNDVLDHGKTNHDQSSIFVSSTDPWHRASDLDKNEEHIGFDRLVSTGLTRGRPMMVPVGLLYDTPENAAAEIAYLTARGIKFDRVELGEEPDGQNIAPLDYATLYLQFAEAIHKVAPNAVLGGPSFQDVVANIGERKDHAGNGLWLRTVLNYLAAHNHKKDFGFMSFEWYPFDDVCAPRAPQVARSSALMRKALDAMRADGLDARIPLVVSEYGYSPFATAAEDDLEGAIVDLDGIGTVLSMGGDAAYLYGYEPDRVEREASCTAGNNMMLLMRPDGSLAKTSTFHAARMMTNDWLQYGGGEHALIAASSSVPNIGVYAVRRPDGRISVLLLNRDAERSASIIVQIDGHSRLRPEPVDEIQFSRVQYEWDEKLGRPTRDDPAARSENDLAGKIDLPPYSITVLREK